MVHQQGPESFFLSEHGATLDSERENDVPTLLDPDSAPLTRRQLRELERTASLAMVPIDEIDKVVVETETADETVAVTESVAPEAPEIVPATTSAIPTFFTGPLPVTLNDEHVARSRKPRRSSAATAPGARKSVTSRIFSGLVMTVVAGLAAVTMLPGSSSSPADAASLSVTSSNELLHATSSTTAQGLDESVAADEVAAARDTYAAAAPVPEVQNRWAGAIGSYTNNPSGSIQWPFAASVPISSPFGYRLAPCAYCSSDHHGVDFVPGEGYPIQSIGTGVVRDIITDRWGYGYHIIIDYPSLGIAAQYAHMQLGSSPLAIGQSVVAGTLVGLVGHTGTVTAPHLHFEIWVNEVPVDPYAWLKAHAN